MTAWPSVRTQLDAAKMPEEKKQTLSEGEEGSTVDLEGLDIISRVGLEYDEYFILSDTESNQNGLEGNPG